VHINHPGTASSYGVEGSFTPTQARSPFRFSFTKQYYLSTEGHTSIGSHSSEVREDKVALQSYTEPRPHSQANGRETLKLPSPPYGGAIHTNVALNVAPQVLKSTATASQPFVKPNPILASPVITRRATLENVKPVQVKAITSPSEQPLAINHTRSCSVPVPLSPVVQRPPSTVAWHLPSRSRSMPKLRESYERSDSGYSLYGISTPPPTATAREDVHQPIVLDAKIFEASRTLKPSSSAYIDPLSVRTSIRSTPSPTLESIMQLYRSFPAPPAPSSQESTAETCPPTEIHPPTRSNMTMIQLSAPTTARPTARPTTAPESSIRPVRPLAIRPRRGGSITITPAQHHGLPSRPHTAGALLVPASQPSSASSQVTLASPKRIHRTTSASGSLTLLAEDSFLVPPRTPPTPRLGTSSSMSSIRPKTPPRPTSSRNAVYFDSGSTKPQPEGAVVYRRQI
jgi:hypothetical protein